MALIVQNLYKVEKGYAWSIETEPFLKMSARVVFGKNCRAQKFIALKNPNVLEGKVGVVTTPKGGKIIVPAIGKIDGVLAFISEEGGFRGGIRRVEEATTCKIVTEAAAGSACKSAILIAGIFTKGDVLTLRKTGRGCKQYVTFTCVKENVVRTVYEDDEYEMMQEGSYVVC